MFKITANFLVFKVLRNTNFLALTFSDGLAAKEARVLGVVVCGWGTWPAKATILWIARHASFLRLPLLLFVLSLWEFFERYILEYVVRNALAQLLPRNLARCVLVKTTLADHGHVS